MVCDGIYNDERGDEILPSGVGGMGVWDSGFILEDMNKEYY